MHIEHNMDNVVDLRVHIAPVGYEEDRIVIPAVLLAFFAGIYWKGREQSSLCAAKRCYVCGKSIGTESSVTDHKRRIFYHFGCWTRVVKHDVFSPDDGTLDV